MQRTTILLVALTLLVPAYATLELPQAQAGPVVRIIHVLGNYTMNSDDACHGSEGLFQGTFDTVRKVGLALARNVSKGYQAICGPIMPSPVGCDDLWDTEGKLDCRNEDGWRVTIARTASPAKVSIDFTSGADLLSPPTHGRGEGVYIDGADEKGNGIGLPIRMSDEPEPNTAWDREPYMWTQPNAQQTDKLYLRVSGSPPNSVGAIQYEAYFGFWRDCDGDGTIGSALFGETYPSLLNLDNSICPVGSRYNDGETVKEFLWVGPGSPDVNDPTATIRSHWGTEFRGSYPGPRWTFDPARVGPRWYSSLDVDGLGIEGNTLQPARETYLAHKGDVSFASLIAAGFNPWSALPSGGTKYAAPGEPGGPGEHPWVVRDVDCATLRVDPPASLASPSCDRLIPG